MARRTPTNTARSAKLPVAADEALVRVQGVPSVLGGHVAAAKNEEKINSSVVEFRDLRGIGAPGRYRAPIATKI